MITGTTQRICLVIALFSLGQAWCAESAPTGESVQEVPAEAPEGALQDEDGQGNALDKCDRPTDETGLTEDIQGGVFEYSCRTVRWFDGLFGSSHEFHEENVYGRVSLGSSWNQYEGWDPSLRLRLRADLPNLSSRWDAFFGRVDEEDYIRDSETRQDSAFRRGINDGEQPEWLFGLGYRSRKPGEGGWDYSVGVRLRFPPQPYVKARYEKTWRLMENQDLRFRHTFFWRNNRGFGATTSFDSAREISDDDILRWELIGTIAEYTEGLDWWAAHTWYHRLAAERGISLRTFARGRTDADVSLREYGFELNFRRQLHREWLFINAGPTLTWPRQRLDERREASWGVAVLLEMDFGYYTD